MGIECFPQGLPIAGGDSAQQVVHGAAHLPKTAIRPGPALLA